MTDLMKMSGIFMHDEDKNAIRSAAETATSKFLNPIFVNIGVAWGGSCYYMRAGSSVATIYGVDLVGDTELVGTKEQVSTLNLKVLGGDSRELHKTFDEPIHFLYIDGDHTPKVLKSDIENWASKVVPFGFVGFHDCLSCHWAKDVNRVIDELMLKDEWFGMGLFGWSRFFWRMK